MKPSFIPIILLNVYFMAIGDIPGQFTSPAPTVNLNKTGSIQIGQDIGIINFRSRQIDGYFSRSAIAAFANSGLTANGFQSGLAFRTWDGALENRLVIMPNGFIGMDVNNPDEQLDLRGNIKIRGSSVNLHEKFLTVKLIKRFRLFQKIFDTVAFPGNPNDV